ncbi:MAG TPA: hypothetical protein VH583_01440 [Vicinamibacterales bacterium]|jgi:hypothetical protein
MSLRSFVIAVVVLAILVAGVIAMHRPRVHVRVGSVEMSHGDRDR